MGFTVCWKEKKIGCVISLARLITHDKSSVLYVSSVILTAENHKSNGLNLIKVGSNSGVSSSDYCFYVLSEIDYFELKNCFRTMFWRGMYSIKILY
jgi:hypothetical protein